MQRFGREAETVARMHHTNIVPIFAVGSDQGIHYYAMQFIEGRNLADVLNEAQEAGAGLSPEDVATWGLQAAEALEYAHRRGVIHRDVKPSNLMLDDEGIVWLTDFGLAKRADEATLTIAGTLMGTPRYMSPEQAEALRHPVDHRTDIYSLGATLYELATGRPVFESSTPHRRHPPHPGRRAGASETGSARSVEGPGDGHPDLPGQEPGRSVRLGPGARRRPPRRARFPADPGPPDRAGRTGDSLGEAAEANGGRGGYGGRGRRAPGRRSGSGLERLQPVEARRPETDHHRAPPGGRSARPRDG